jgi:hypothetical protein
MKDSARKADSGEQHPPSAKNYGQLCCFPRRKESYWSSKGDQVGNILYSRIPSNQQGNRLWQVIVRYAWN